MKKLFFTAGVLFSLMVFPLNAQVKHSHEVVLGNLQLKEGNNLGMVFNGIQFEYRYGLTWIIQEHEIMYQPKIGFGAAFSHDIIGVQIKFTPVNVNWTMPVYKLNGHTIRVGANFATDYSWQMYPDLQSGTLFWASIIGISPIVKYNYQWNNKRIGINIQNSLFGFSSHKQGDYTYWYYHKNASEWIVTPHETMKFGSFNHYNHTTVSLEFVPNITKKHSIIYEFDYLGFFQGIQFHRINHNFIWRISL
jgi:hypothetical protein